MSVLYAVAGSGHSFTFSINVPATSTPTVGAYSDTGRTTLVETCAVTGSGTAWSFTVPADLPAGTYYLKITAATAGGTAVDVSDSLIVTSSAIVVQSGLCTLAEVKQQLDKTTTADDVELQAYIDAVTQPIEDYKGEVLQQVRTEVYNPTGDTIVLRAERIVSVSSVTAYLGTSGTAYTPVTSLASAGNTTYYVDPSLNGVIKRWNSAGYVRWDGPVEVTYTAGYATVPANINLAARFLVQSLWQSQQGGTGLPPVNGEPLDPVSFYAETIERSPRVRMLLGQRRTSGIG